MPKKSANAKAQETATSYATPALEKGLDILELLAHERDGLTKSEIARALQRTVSEIFRMLLCLERRGYIIETTADKYALSLQLYRMVQEHPPTERMLAEALPRMHALVEKVQQSCHLGVLEAGKVIILAQTNAPGSVGFYVKPGSAIDLMEAATGQAVLAHMPTEEIDRVLEEWRKETGGRVPSDFSRHLEKIRKRGYEKRASYQVRGVINISFPIFGARNVPVAALTVPYIQRMDGGLSIEEVEAATAEAAKAISAAIGAV